MILSKEEVLVLLDGALERVEAPDGCGAVIEGSIAEGFGNASSDVDLLLVDESPRRHPLMPSVVFVDDWRVEVRVRSADDLRRQIEELRRLARSGPARVPKDLLDRCQRFSRAVPLRRPTTVTAIQRELAEHELAEIVAAWFAHHARAAGRRAVATAALGLGVESANWARTALLQAAKVWAARHGETYVELKWLPKQLARAPGGAAIAERVEELEVPPEEEEEEAAEAYVRRCLHLVAELGVNGCDYAPERLTLARRRDATTWQLGEQVHVVRRRREVFALGTHAARVWRSLLFDTPLPEALAHAGPSSGRTIGEFHRLGLLGLRWRGAGEISRDFSTTPPPVDWRPIVSLEGGVRPSGSPEVALLPLPAERFAAAGMALVWTNMMVENAREDAVGARAHGQWGVFRTAMRRMVRQACRSVLAAHGVMPLPPLEESVAHLASLPGVDAEAVATALPIERGVTVEDDDAAADALDVLDSLVASFRAGTDARLFPASFDSRREWRRTIEIGYDWVRLGAFLDAAFPVDDARDLLSSATRLSPAGSPSAAPSA